MTTALYPAFLRLDGLPVIVVGGGPVAAGKLDGLLAAGARVTVVAPVIDGAIRDRARAGTSITLVERAFTPADLDGARWVVAAAPPEVNREVAAAATARGLFVNAVDDTASASAYLGAVIRRGDERAGVVELAISTRGVAPALAGLLREALDAVLPAELDRWIDVARAERAAWKREGLPMAERRPRLLEALVRLYDRAAPAPHRTAPRPTPRLLRMLDRMYAGGWTP